MPPKFAFSGEKFERDIGLTRTSTSTIFLLLIEFRHAQCQNDSDRLFALLSVSNDVELGEKSEVLSQFQALKIWFRPDYMLGTSQVYRTFAIAALRSPLAFELLQCAGAFRNSYNNSPKIMPSWVPDWRCKMLYKPWVEKAVCPAGRPSIGK